MNSIDPENEVDFENIPENVNSVDSVKDRDLVNPVEFVKS